MHEMCPFFPLRSIVQIHYRKIFKREIRSLSAGDIMVLHAGWSSLTVRESGPALVPWSSRVVIRFDLTQDAEAGIVVVSSLSPVVLLTTS